MKTTARTRRTGNKSAGYVVGQVLAAGDEFAVIVEAGPVRRDDQGCYSQRYSTRPATPDEEAVARQKLADKAAQTADARKADDTRNP